MPFIEGAEDTMEKSIENAEKQKKATTPKPCKTVEITNITKCPSSPEITSTTSSLFDVSSEIMYALKTLRSNPDYDYNGRGKLNIFIIYLIKYFHIGQTNLFP